MIEYVSMNRLFILVHGSNIDMLKIHFCHPLLSFIEKAIGRETEHTGHVVEIKRYRIFFELDR